MPFTDNYRDLSNSEGYQFEFHCERCGNGYRSAYVRDKVEMGRGLLRSVGSLFGGAAENLSRSVEQWRYDRATNSPAKDRALTDAVAEVSPQFRQCRGCGQWMCAAMCWNDDIGQCLSCSPAVAEEMSRAQASAQREQIWDKARNTDWTENLDLGTRTKVECPSCKAKVDGGKFCSSCGGQLAIEVRCGGCGSTTNRPGAVFCSDCGKQL
ncbi:zinc ribbon domain-containing protein [Solihabitans fulvus]|uniref:Zinc ribbon domain-containing protein n=1 Tax=Solihabitans fulvus TaxID=1892852 RepID=A0A5B2XPZ3_9PSEU|nr:zinc ribbon domain-containing protein [Solihabitans fulvus]